MNACKPCFTLGHCGLTAFKLQQRGGAVPSTEVEKRTPPKSNTLPQKHCASLQREKFKKSKSVCRGSREEGQNVSESSESFSVVPSLDGPEGFLGLR